MGYLHYPSQFFHLIPLHLCSQEGITHSLRVLKAAGALEVATLHNDVHCWWTVSQVTGEDGRSLLVPKPEPEFEDYITRVRAAGCVVNDVPLFSAHQTGSCPMGTSPRNSAVDENGESWEVAGLFLGDGSVFPTPVGVNPMVSIESVAYLLGQRLAKRWHRSQFQ